MWILTELQQQLHQQLAALDGSPSWVELQAEIAAENVDLLSWLKGQTAFPQCFWQSRDQSLTFASVGAALPFTDLDAAQSFSQQFGFHLLGGLKFEGQCHFVLPRLLLTQQSGKLTARLYLNGNAFSQEKQACEAICKMLANFDPLQAIQHTITAHQQASDFQRWQRLIDNAIFAIEQGQFRKVVLANATQLTLDKPLSAYDLLAASQQQNRHCYHFLWAENTEQAFIGSSPERLYQRQDRQFITEALAGTVAVSDDEQETQRNAEWLLNDEKNIYENQLVVDDICQHLADCVSDIQVSQAEIKRLPNVQHLRRHIQATLKAEIKDSDCLPRIQPTAAVAGLPRHKALPFITEHEGFERGWYAGTLGYLLPHAAEFCVTLRSAQLKQNQITLYAGAGIVAASKAQAEWLEIERKKLAIARLFNC